MRQLFLCNRKVPGTYLLHKTLRGMHMPQPEDSCPKHTTSLSVSLSYQLPSSQAHLSSLPDSAPTFQSAPDSVLSPDVLPQRWCSSLQMAGSKSHTYRSSLRFPRCPVDQIRSAVVKQAACTLRLWLQGSAWSDSQPVRCFPR